MTKVVIQACRGSAENTFFPYVHSVYTQLFKQLKEHLGWEIEYNSRPSVKEEFGDPHGQHHTVIKIEGQKPIVIDERETTYVLPSVDDLDCWFILKFAYRDHEEFYVNKGRGIDNDEKSKNLGGCKNTIIPWFGHAFELERWPNHAQKEWSSNFDKEINLIFTGTERTNRDTRAVRSQTCRSIERFLPEKSYIGLHMTPYSRTKGVIGNIYEHHITEMLYNDYKDKMSKARIGLSLPGNGLSCYREFEYFFSCIPCIAPKFQVKYSDPLIPGVHYVAFDDSDPKTFKDAYDSLQDREFYDSISINAWNWWNKNCNPKRILSSFLEACGKIDSFRETFKKAYNE